MKATCALLLFASIAVAQTPNTKAPAACGPWDLSFDVQLDASPSSSIEPEPGKAQIYFIQDDAGVRGFGYPITKIGIDGKWVGANKKNSYLAVSVTSGEHHLCVAEQRRTPWDSVELAHFAADAGKVYYFRIQRTQFAMNGFTQYLAFHPVDSDEGKYLISKYPLSVPHLKK